MVSSTPEENTLLLSLPLTIFLAAYTLSITIFGLLGNSVVVYSSLRYNSIQLDAVSVRFVQNLAVADLLYIIFNVLPSAITYIAGQYVLGKAYCFINAVVSFIPGSVNTLTIFLLTSYRLLIVMYPHRVMTLRRAHVLIVSTWVAGLAPVMVAVAYEGESVFVRTYAACVSDVYERKDARVVVGLCLGAIIVLPVIATTAINAVLCGISLTLRKKLDKKVKKSSHVIQNTGTVGGLERTATNQSCVSTKSTRGSKNNPLTTVCLLSGCFLISWIPFVIYVTWKTKDAGVPPELELVAFHAIQLNSVCNPILYTMTNKRFGKYVRQLVWRYLPCKGDHVNSHVTQPGRFSHSLSG